MAGADSLEGQDAQAAKGSQVDPGETEGAPGGLSLRAFMEQLASPGWQLGLIVLLALILGRVALIPCQPPRLIRHGPFLSCIQGFPPEPRKPQDPLANPH